jgi:hypothetical protein
MDLGDIDTLKSLEVSILIVSKKCHQNLWITLDILAYCFYTILKIILPQQHKMRAVSLPRFNRHG